MLVTADCFPVALARTRTTAAHRPSRWLAWPPGGIAAEGVAAMAGNGIAAAIGPGIGPCCYEVGEEVAEPFRTRFGDDVWTAATSTSGLPRSERYSKQDAPPSSATGIARPARKDPLLHRRDRGRTGRQGVIAYIV